MGGAKGEQYRKKSMNKMDAEANFINYYYHFINE